MLIGQSLLYSFVSMKSIAAATSGVCASLNRSVNALASAAFRLEALHLPPVWFSMAKRRRLA
jgi:hypothetical protein